MLSPETNTDRKDPLHFVGYNPKDRAGFAQLCLSLGHHCELYEDLSELSSYPPRHGIIVLQDSADYGGIVEALGRLERNGIWLSVIAVGEDPSPGTIVAAIKAGALDYLTWPIDRERLERSLQRTAKEGEKLSNLRKRRVDAQAKIAALSARESEVLSLLTEGSSNKVIARELEISPRTVEIHRANMMNKLGASHAASAVRIKLEANHALL